MGNMTSGDRHVTVSVRGPVATITLDREERLNAFTASMARQLVEAIDRTDQDDAVRAVILTGRGRAFCAGADLSAGEHPNAGSPEIAGMPRDAGGVVSLRFAASVKPMIAAVNGPAVGVGATMILPADVRIAADSATFGYVFVRRGIVPESASSWFLPRVVGISRASEWVLTGRKVSAEEALEAGLVSRVVPRDELDAAALEIAHMIAENTSPAAVAASRQLLWSQLSEPSPWTAHVAETFVISQLKRGGDPAEGAASFLEKRPPRFPMSVVNDYPPAAPRWPEPPVDLEEAAQRLHD